jgi:glycosyltransferase involved in cell wall biosynthesis
MKSLRSFYRWFIRALFYRFQHLAFQFAFEDQLQDWKPDVVHCNDWQSLALGSHIKRKLGSYLIFDSHELETHRNPPLTRARRRWMQAYEQRHFKQCDLITTVGPTIARYLAKAYKIEEPLVVYNAPIDDKARRPLAFERWGRSPNQGDLRSEIGIAGHSVLLVAVGKVTLNRGLETAIEALGLLPDHVNLALLGGGTDSFLSYLKRFVEDRGHESRVHFVEPVNPYCVTEFVACADLALVPLRPLTLSYELTLPNKLFECAFAGLPIIASDSYELNRFVERHRLGVTFPADDAFALAEAIGSLIETKPVPAAAEDLKRFRQTYGFETCAAPVLDKIAAAPLLD